MWKMSDDVEIDMKQTVLSSSKRIWLIIFFSITSLSHYPYSSQILLAASLLLVGGFVKRYIHT